MSKRGKCERVAHVAQLSMSPEYITDNVVYYKVLMTCVLHTARISNVDSIMFFDRKVEMVNFELGVEFRKMFFCLVTSMGQDPSHRRVFVAQW